VIQVPQHRLWGIKWISLLFPLGDVIKGPKTHIGCSVRLVLLELKCFLSFVCLKPGIECAPWEYLSLENFSFLWERFPIRILPLSSLKADDDP